MSRVRIRHTGCPPTVRPSASPARHSLGFGLPVARIKTSGGSDANILRALGFDCVNLTHGVAGFHGPDERVAVSDLVVMKDVILGIIDESTKVEART